MAFVVLKLVLLCVLSWQSRYVMDEYNEAHTFVHAQEGFYKGYEPYKTVLYVYYYGLAHQLGQSTVDLMHAARMLSLLLVFGIIYLVWLIGRALGYGSYGALFCVAVLLSFSTFMERAFRVRSEPMALLFALLALYLMVRRPGFSRFKLFLVGLVSALSFLNTQKAAYFVVALALALAVVLLSETTVKLTQRLRRSLLFGTWFILGFIVAMMVYAMYFKGINFLEVWTSILTRPFKMAVSGGTLYPKISQYYTQTWERNILAYLLCLGGLAYGLARYRYQSQSARLVAFWSLGLVLFTLYHKQPWPYFFIFVIPALSLFCLPLIERCAPLFSAKLGKNGLGVIVLLLLSISFVRNLRYLNFDNRKQNEVTSYAETLLSQNDTYLDGIFMLPDRCQGNHIWLDRTWIKKITTEVKTTGESTILSGALSPPPKLIIWNYRIKKLKKTMTDYLDKGYIHLPHNIYLAGYRARTDSDGRATIKVVREGKYRLVVEGSEKEVNVDGQPAFEDSFLLAKGDHELKLTGGSRRFCFYPADVNLAEDLLLTENKLRKTSLFARHYSF